MGKEVTVWVFVFLLVWVFFSGGVFSVQGDLTSVDGTHVFLAPPSDGFTEKVIDEDVGFFGRILRFFGFDEGNTASISYR